MRKIALLLVLPEPQAHALHIVEIASTDDSVYRPANNTQDSHTSLPAGVVQLVADCDHGRWQSLQDGQLLFQLATARVYS